MRNLSAVPRLLSVSLLVLGLGVTATGCGSSSKSAASGSSSTSTTVTDATTSTAAGSSATSTTAAVNSTAHGDGMIHYTGAVTRDVDATNATCSQLGSSAGGEYTVSVVDPQYDATTPGFTIKMSNPTSRQNPFVPAGPLSTSTVTGTNVVDIQANTTTNTEYAAAAGDGPLADGTFNLDVASTGLTGTVTGTLQPNQLDGVNTPLTINGSWNCATLGTINPLG